jgi:hypothetical protein
LGDDTKNCQLFSAECSSLVDHTNGIKPVIDKVFGFDEVQAAYKHMASGAPEVRAARATCGRDEPRVCQLSPAADHGVVLALNR